MEQKVSSPKFKKFFSKKVFLIMSFTALVSGFVTGGLGFYLNINTVKSNKKNSGKDLVLYLSQSSETSIVSREEIFLVPAFNYLLNSRGFLYAAVYDEKGHLLFSKSKEKEQQIESNISPFKTAKKDKVKTLNRGNDFLELAIPVFGTRIDSEALTFGNTGKIKTRNIILGYSVIRISTKLTLMEKKQALKSGLIIGLAVFFLGILFSWGATAKISGPIKKIISGVDLLQKGNLETRIKVESQDEMGQISDSFNRLARNLSQKIDQLQNWSKTLEKEVVKRTEMIINSGDFMKLLISPLSGKPSSIENIIKNILFKSKASGASLFLENEKPSLDQVFSVTTNGTEFGVKPVKLSQPKQTLPASELNLQDLLGENGVVVFYQLFIKNEINGQLVLGFKNSEISSGFMDQVIPAITITLSNTKAFNRLNNLTEILENRNETLVKQQDELISQKQEAIKQKKALEISNKLKSEFISNVTHELRIPLNAIIGYSEMLTAGYYGELNSEQNNSLNGIEESGKNLLNLINTILDHSQLEAGKFPVFIRTSDDLRENIRETISRNQSLTREKPYNITFDLPSSPIPCINDTGKIQQILTNLLSNAIKFTKEGKVHVILNPKRDLIEISVEDTGIGISPENHEFIFQEFRQIDGSSTRAFGGTGLGLTVSKKLAKLVGGEIKIESELNKGSKFIFQFQRRLKK
jgi:signal transduction histidine kinase/HAMP domain-containing protein